MTLYADERRWAIVFEKSGYSNTGFRGEIELTYFGNCLTNLRSEGSADAFTSNMKNVMLIDTPPLENDMDGLISRKIKQLQVRDTLLSIEQNKSVYEKKGIRDPVYDKEDLIDLPSLIRYLDEENPTLFRATDKELKKCLPADLPKLMQIDEWYHEAYTKYKNMTSPTEYHYEIMGKKPGDYETYKMIADILVSRDPTKWRPMLKPNNNWRNWPNAGYM